jgi:hypothetical protein
MNVPLTSGPGLRKAYEDAAQARHLARPALAARNGAALRFLAALCATMTTPALAQDVTINLTGEVEGVCGVQDDAGGPVLIDFGMLSAVAVGQQTPEVTHDLSIICNDPDGGTLTVESVNGGNLQREGSSGGEGNEVGYSVSASGTAAIDFAPTDLSDPVSRNFLGSADLLTSRGVTLRFRANGVSAPSPAGNGGTTTTVYAGVYRDIVKVSVTAN